MTDSGNDKEKDTSSLCVLIVDDSAMMRTLVKRATLLTGLASDQIYEAADGQQALAILEKQHVDALFTDINMPVMTGIELLRRIAGDERWRRMARIVLSTDGSAARRSEVAALGVEFYIDKPFRPEAVRDVLSAITEAQ